MMIGIQVAMPAELDALSGASEWEYNEEVGGAEFYQVASNVVACVGGVGKVNAALSADLLGRRYGADLILNVGVAGCMTDLPIGSLVVASELVQHDVDTTAVGDPLGLVSTVNRTVFPVWEPDHCVELLRAQGQNAVTGRVATGDWFAVKGQRSAWIRENFSPLLVEMEACAIAQVCLRNGTQFVALKSVSDHIFSDGQAGEYFDFRQALENLGKAAIPLALALAEDPLLAKEKQDPFPLGLEEFLRNEG